MSSMNKPHPREFTALPLMPHQRAALRRAWGRAGFALLAEQGTGKTLVLLAEALALYAEGEIDAVLVLAPNGVHQNWVLTEVPVSIPRTIPHIAAYYASAPTRKERGALERLMEVRGVGEVPPLRILAMSYDALLTAAGFRFAEAFVQSARVMIVADESHKIKSISASRTKRALNIRRHCHIRRISTGTAIANSPMDAFAQFEFLEEGLLGETSFTAFRAQYAVLLPAGHGLLRHILARKERALGRKLSLAEQERAAPAIIEQDAAGRPKYKNLPRLHSLIAEHSFRVLKEDCLDLPPKTYETLYFHLTKAQRAVYDRMENELRYILEDGALLTTTKLVALSKLLQITSGFLLMRDGSVSYLEDNPRITLLAEQTEDETRQGIIWSQFHEEQRSIARVMREAQQSCEVVNSGVSMKRRREIISEFQAGNLQWINPHPGTLGSGFTLTAGTLNYYYSNGYNMVDRLQSEDRTHRKGTSDTVLYRDFVAIDTRDDNVVWALQHKLDTAAMIQGDPERESRFGNRERKEDVS